MSSDESCPQPKDTGNCQDGSSKCTSGGCVGVVYGTESPCGSALMSLGSDCVCRRNPALIPDDPDEKYDIIITMNSTRSTGESSTSTYTYTNWSPGGYFNIFGQYIETYLAVRGVADDGTTHTYFPEGAGTFVPWGSSSYVLQYDSCSGGTSGPRVSGVTTEDGVISASVGLIGPSLSCSGNYPVSRSATFTYEFIRR